MAEPIQRISSSRQIYPWSDWMNGKAWRAHYGKDFKCSPIGFMASLYGKASRAGRKVSVANHGKYIEFQFDEPTASNRKRTRSLSRA